MHLLTAATHPALVTLAALAALGAGLTGLGVIVRWLWRAGRALSAAVTLVQRELSPNGGGTVKDHAASTAADVSALRDDVAALRADHEAHVAEKEAALKEIRCELQRLKGPRQK